MPKEVQKDEESLEDEKLAKGCIVGLISFLFLLILPYILGGVLLSIFDEYTEIAWYGRGYYLQQDIFIEGETGYGLYYLIDGEKVLILPHVYGYKKEGSYLYFAAGEGSGIISLKNGTAKITQPKGKDSPSDNIIYTTAFDTISHEKQLLLSTLPHSLNAYFYNAGWTDSYAVKIGDGRFQYKYVQHSSEYIERRLEVYGLYGNFDEQNTLLEDVTGLRIEEKSQMMYVTSPHGCAVIDGLSGTCRVLLTNRDAAPPDYQKDIQVLDSFDQFTPEEQAILLEVEKEGFK